VGKAAKRNNILIIAAYLVVFAMSMEKSPKMCNNKPPDDSLLGRAVKDGASVDVASVALGHRFGA
jgi:hypothetical protein